jgi:hypothetical protein
MKFILRAFIQFAERWCTFRGQHNLRVTAEKGADMKRNAKQLDG